MNDIWFGTEAAFTAAVDARSKYEAYRANNKEDTVQEQSPYLSISDGVGIVTVAGALYDGRFGRFGQMFGIMGYGDIQEALLQAVASVDVRSILLVIKSGGGMVSGLNETQQMLATVDKHKPIITYSPSTMASAALWMGVTAREVLISDTAIVGSIGTITVMASRAEQLKKEGIDARVIRSGKYKALGHPAEPLSDEAIAETQEKIDYMSSIFLKYVADRRGTTAAAADKAFGQGREFVGAQAVQVGLVDAVSTYSQAFYKAKAKADADNKPRVVGGTVAAAANGTHNTPQPKGNSMPNAHIPTDEQIAAMAAAGVVLDAAAETAAATTPAATTPATTPATDEQAAPEADADDSSIEAVTAQLSEVSAKLATVELKFTELEASAAASAAQIQELQAQLATAETAAASVKDLSAIVAASIKTMSVALNAQAEDLSGADGATLAVKHKEAAEKFKKTFKAGRVSATAAETEQPAVTTVNPMFLAAASLNQGI